MKLATLSKTDQELYGATHCVTITFADLAAGAAALTQTYNILPATTNGVMPALGTSGTDNLPQTGFQAALVAAILDTPFSGGTIATATLTIGDSLSAARYLAATNVFTGATAFHFSGIVANQPFTYTAAANLTCLFTTTVGNCNAATAGQVRIYLRAVNLNKLATS